jgi:SAM-dependent methyltransferase
MTADSELTSYDNINTENYLAHIERPLSWNNIYERPAFIERLPALEGKNVLDAGCASGYYTQYALKHGATVTAVDISRKLLGKLEAKVKSEKLTLQRADISKPMPFLKSNSFDCVIASLVLHYIKDWEPLLAELYRVLKKGGRLVISTHHPFDTYSYLKLPSYFQFKLVEETWAASSPRPFKVRFYVRPLCEVLKPIIESKFKIISIDEPLPTEECKKLDPRAYQRLMERPSFLFIVLEK